MPRSAGRDQPADGREIRHKAGGLGRIENPWGVCFEKAKITPILKPGYIQAQHGWWFPEEDAEAPHLYGVWKSNINTLIPHSRQGKLGFGAPFRTTLVKISKAQKATWRKPTASALKEKTGSPSSTPTTSSASTTPSSDPAAR